MEPASLRDEEDDDIAQYTQRPTPTISRAPSVTTVRQRATVASRSASSASTQLPDATDYAARRSRGVTPNRTPPPISSKSRPWRAGRVWQMAVLTAAALACVLLYASTRLPVAQMDRRQQVVRSGADGSSAALLISQGSKTVRSLKDHDPMDDPCSTPRCGIYCCQPGELCLAEQCCSREQACGGKCCPAGYACLNGQCCPVGQVGSGQCCAQGQLWTNQGCCNLEFVCGNTCCTDGQCDPKTQQCCAKGGVILDRFGGCCPQEQMCTSIETGSFCCPTGLRCFEGVCKDPRTWSWLSSCNQFDLCGPPAQKQCCTLDEMCFNNQRCCKKSNQCGSDCCGTGQSCCGNARCCSVDQTCLGTQCFPFGSRMCGTTVCLPGQQCIENRMCCSATAVMCGGRCCDGATSCVLNQCVAVGSSACNGVVCPPGSTCQGSICCPSGFTGCSGKCCPGDSSCQMGQCVGSGMRMCAAGVQCPVGSSCCGGSCCSPGQTCSNGLCCAGPVCGGFCCASGQFCGGGGWGSQTCCNWGVPGCGGGGGGYYAAGGFPGGGFGGGGFGGGGGHHHYGKKKKRKLM